MDTEVLGIDHLHLYVGDARRAANDWSAFLGFTPLVLRNPRPSATQSSVSLTQGDISLVVTDDRDPDGDVARFVRRHGAGVKDVALRVGDTVHAFERAVRNGARPVREPTTTETSSYRRTTASVAAFGDLVHSFVDHDHDGDGDGVPCPGGADTSESPPPGAGLRTMDHVAICVPAGGLDDAADFYRDVLGFSLTREERVETPTSAMNSKVVEAGTLAFVLVEPAEGERESQIANFLRRNDGPGVQHAAFRTDDIVGASGRLRSRGLPFLDIPDTYYARLTSRIGEPPESVAVLRTNGILADRDEWGYLLQQFSRPIVGRDTFFVELIQRRNARGFGSGNIRALFEAVEQDQELRRSADEPAADENLLATTGAGSP